MSEQPSSKMVMGTVLDSEDGEVFEHAMVITNAIMEIYGISSANDLFTGEMMHGPFVTCDAFEFNQGFEGLDVLFSYGK